MEVPGQRQNSVRVVHEQYTYHLDSRYATKARKRYLCSSRITSDNCRAKLWKGGNGAIEVVGEHNHPLPNIQHREPVIRELQVQALADDLLPNQIINNVIRNIPNAANHSMEASRQVIHRARRHHRPPLPLSFNDVGPMLLQYQRVHNIYRHQVIAEDGSTAYIFGSNEMLLRLGEVTEWHLDGTFQCVPQRPRAEQLFIIHTRQMDVGIPGLYILCSNRTSTLYNCIFNWILEQVPAVRQNLETVVSDFEAAILRALEVSMPWVNRRGCWFHFARAVTRKWNSLGLAVRGTPEHRILCLTWALPLVPVDRFREALDVIINLLLPLENVNESYYLFRRYLERYWLPLANIVSVYNSPWRTNNISEAFNRHLVAKVGQHPNFFYFLHRLIELTQEDKNLLTALNNGVDIGRNRRQRQYHMDLYIMRIQQALETRRYSMVEFLEMAVIRRAEVQFQLDAAVMRPQYFDDNLAIEEEVLLLQYLPALLHPIIPRIEDDQYYENEVIIEDNEEAPWIQALAEGMVFEDQRALDNANLCCVCLENQAKAAFIPCGDLCLCLICKYKAEESAARAVLPGRNQGLICYVCQTPSNAIINIFL